MHMQKANERTVIVNIQIMHFSPIYSTVNTRSDLDALGPDGDDLGVVVRHVEITSQMRHLTLYTRIGNMVETRLKKHS